MTLISLRSLSVRHKHGLADRAALDAVSLDIHAGECVGLIGPNGAGKTTLLRAALGLLPHEGHSSLAALPRLARARHVAWLPQTRSIAWAIRVDRLVALGRTPHGRRQDADAQAVSHALGRMGLEALRHRPATELSGGEQARVLIARALAQETPLLLADEPIAGLDPAAQITTLDTFRTLADEGRAVLTSLHDLSLAARYCSRLVLLDKGRIAADGPPEHVLTLETLAQVFHLDARLHHTKDGLLVQAVGSLV